MFTFAFWSTYLTDWHTLIAKLIGFVLLAGIFALVTDRARWRRTLMIIASGYWLADPISYYLILYHPK